MGILDKFKRRQKDQRLVTSSGFDPKPKFKKGDRVRAHGQVGTIMSGPRWDPEGENLCWFCHTECDSSCSGDLFGDRCGDRDCKLCAWAQREHGYTATSLQ